MKTRVISAVVLLPLLFALVLFAPKMMTAVVMAVLLAIAAYELLYRTGLLKNTRLVAYACTMAFAVAMWSHAGAIHAYMLIGLMLYSMILFTEMMIDHVKIRIEMLTLCYFAGALVPFLLSALIRILGMSIGRYVILIPFIIAFLSDSGAYFVGLKFGRHKLAPVVSPHKTVEGALGGIVAAMVGMLIYGIVLKAVFPQFEVRLGLAVLYGLLGSLCGIFGDLCFSVIKRQTGIKDYGNLIPGHGGVLDRLDSMMMVAPLVEAMLLLAPMVI